MIDNGTSVSIIPGSIFAGSTEIVGNLNFTADAGDEISIYNYLDSTLTLSNPYPTLTSSYPPPSVFTASSTFIASGSSGSETITTSPYAGSIYVVLQQQSHAGEPAITSVMDNVNPGSYTLGAQYVGTYFTLNIYYLDNVSTNVSTKVTVNLAGLTPNGVFMQVISIANTGTPSLLEGSVVDAEGTANPIGSSLNFTALNQLGFVAAGAFTGATGSPFQSNTATLIQSFTTPGNEEYMGTGRFTPTTTGSHPVNLIIDFIQFWDSIDLIIVPPSTTTEYATLNIVSLETS